MPNLVYVANVKTNTVSVCSLEKELATVPMLPFPARIAFTPDQHYAYVSNSQSNAVSIIDTTTHTVVHIIREIPIPVGIAFAHDGAYAYVTTNTVPTGAVYVIDTATRLVKAKIPVGKGPAEVAISPNGELVCVANYNSHDLSVIATQTNQVIQTIPMCWEPGGVCFHPSGQRAYVSTACGPFVGSDIWWIAIINPQNLVWTGANSFPVDDNPWSLAVSPDGRRLFATSGVGLLGQGNLIVIDLVTSQELTSFNLSQWTGYVSVTSSGEFCLVSDPAGDRVAVIRTADLQVVWHIQLPTGSWPYGLAAIGF